MKPKYIVGALIAAVCVVAAVMVVENEKIEYADFAAAAESGRTVQVKGVWVKEKGCNYDTDADQFHFVMRDDNGVEMPVVLAGGKPNNFELSESVVATGVVEGNLLHASKVLTKCPSKYESGGPNPAGEAGGYDGTVGS